MHENSTSVDIWGPYPNYDDIARFEYGRRLWRDSHFRQRLLNHWMDDRHPYRDRFKEQRKLIEEILASDKNPAELDDYLRSRETSLRCVAREIPPVFGAFWSNSRTS